MMKLHNVTLCAVDCMSPSLAADALVRSTENIEFGDVFLLTDSTTPSKVSTRTISAIRSRESYSDFVIKHLPEHISTEYVLIAQWDGFVIDARRWTPEFLNFDYIGARWAWFNDGMTVGNGGFSLRSKRLLDSAARLLDGKAIIENEDTVICRAHRRELESKFGVGFAPPALADRFSYERTAPAEPSFGFHGLFNFWRHFSDQEIISLLPLLHGNIIRSREYLELLMKYLADRKFSVVESMYRALAANESPAATESRIATLHNDPSVGASVARFLFRIIN